MGGFTQFTGATWPMRGICGWWSSDGTLFKSNAGSGAAPSADGDTVGYLTDKSGNGIHMKSLADDTTRPTFKTPIQNGLPSILFDGSNDFVTSAAIGPATTSKIITMVLVLRTVVISTGAVSKLFFYNGDTAQGCGFGQTDAGRVLVFDQVAAPIYSSMGTAAQTEIWMITVDTNRLTWFTVNGQVLQNTAVLPSVVGNFTAPANKTVIGGHPGNSNWGNYHFFEAAIWNVVLGGTEKRNAILYLQDKYNL